MNKNVNKTPRILYFIDGPLPSEKQMLEREALAPCNVSFRNAQFAGGSLEKCDAVAGCVPEHYAAVYPKAEEVIAQFANERREAYRSIEQERLGERAKGAENVASAAGAKAKKEAEKATKATKKAAQTEAEAKVKAEAAAKAKEEAEAKVKPIVGREGGEDGWSKQQN